MNSDSLRVGRQPANIGFMGQVGQRGIALVLVLWVLVLLSTMAVALVAAQRTETELVTNLVEVRRAQGLAEGGIYLGVARILDERRRRSGEWAPDGTPEVWPVGGREVAVSIIDESGRVDLNAAPASLIEGLLTAAGAASARGTELTDAILDWRDADDNHRLHGAEDPDYRAAGLEYGSKDARFDSIEELQLVLGMTPALYRTLAPALTVYTKRANVNSFFASDLVAAAVSGGEEGEGEGEGAPEPPRGAVTAHGPVYRITALVTLSSGSSAGMEAVVRVAGGRGQYDILRRWYRGSPAKGDQEPESGR